jgi:multiple sugar transport system permease protein
LFVLLIIVFVVQLVFPFLWMFMFSFNIQVISWPPKFVWKPVLQHFEKIFGEQNFFLYIKNSMIVGISAVVISLVIGLPAAYSIARFAQKKLLILVIAARLMPGILFLMPGYIIFPRARLMDSYAALIFSHILICLPIVIWIMSSYFESVPRELEEAAIVDGATRQRAFFSIILPLSMPGVVTAAALSFIFSWNNFMFSQVLSMDKTRTLPAAVYNFMSYDEVDWGGVMAAAAFVIMPAIIITVICRKYIVRGLAVGAIKG